MKTDFQQWREGQDTERKLGFWFPIVLFFAALPGWITPSNATFIVMLGTATLTGLAALFFVVFRQRGVRLSWVLSSGLLLGYAGGALNTDIGLMRNGTDMAEYFGRLQSDLSGAVAIVMWICALLFLVGGVFESPLAVRVARLAPGDHKIPWIGLAVVILAFMTGDLVFDGAKLAPDQRVSVLGDLGALFVQILPGATIILLTNSKFRRHTGLLLLLILAEFCLMILIGRRVLIYGVTIACLAGTIVGLRLNLSRGKKIVLVVFALLMVTFGLRFFFAMRVTNWRLGTIDDLSSGQLIAQTLETMTDKGDSSVDEAFSENLRDRTSIILYLSDLISASRTHPPLHGEDAVYSFKRSIPSALYPNKEDVLMSEEAIANPRFGLVVEDDANSILTTGVSDFGVLGCFLYPLLLIAGFRLLLSLVRSRASETAFVVALVSILTLLIQAEAGLPAYVELARNVLIIAIAITIAKNWPSVRRRREAEHRLLTIGTGQDRTATANY